MEDAYSDAFILGFTLSFSKVYSTGGRASIDFHEPSIRGSGNFRSKCRE
jgi:hypothetical protein